MTLFDSDDAATPLTHEEVAGLKPTHITTRAEVNELEANNILEAESWTFGRRHKNLLSEDFLLALHKRMFGKVWRWAGEYRATAKNLGVAPACIRPDIRYLLDDARYWLEHGTHEPDEGALRFHHRLVAIHPFTNGNGRHSRLMADLIARKLGVDRFTWGKANLVIAGEVRTRYIEALRDADCHDYRRLLLFGRS